MSAESDKILRDVKRCGDYARFGITTHTYYPDPNGEGMICICRDGRQLYATRSRGEAALFAEELYSKLLAIEQTNSVRWKYEDVMGYMKKWP